MLNIVNMLKIIMLKLNKVFNKITPQQIGGYLRYLLVTHSVHFLRHKVVKEESVIQIWNSELA